MAGLFAWAADVVGGGGAGGHDNNDPNSIPLIFTPEQLSYAQELDRKAASLSSSIQDLRLRLPPPDISQRLPDLHAHSLASNAALALQLNAHSATKEQVQLREIRLREENAEYEKAISNCENKMRERLQELHMLHSKLEELNFTEKKLKFELESVQAARTANQSEQSSNLAIEAKAPDESQDEEEEEDAKSALIYKLENKKLELSSIEEIVQNLEKQWAKVQDDAMKKPSPAQREKILDKQLHGLIEQLEGKQAQAEHLVNEIHLKEMELERLNGLSRSLETSTSDANIARNRHGRSGSEKRHASSDYIADTTVGRTEALQRLMLLRSAFVLYILALHILVFIKISF